MDRANHFLKKIKTPTAQEITDRIDKWDCIKLKKNFGSAEKFIYLSEEMAKEWEMDEENERLIQSTPRTQKH